MKTKCPSNSCPCNAEERPEVWKCNYTGIWLYTKLPNNMRVATKNDFFHNGSLSHGVKYGIKYLAKSFFDETYHVCYFTENTNLFEFSYFLTANQIFIQNTKTS